MEVYRQNALHGAHEEHTVDPVTGEGMKDMFYRKDVSMGTTIIAAKYNGGIVVGADSRTSSGSYVVNRVSDKITSVADNIFVARSGSAADTQVLTDYVRHYLSLHTLELGEEPEVKTAANLFRMLAYHNKNHLTAGLIVAGYDKRNGASIYNISLGGAVVEQPLAAGGSGSTYIFGFLDSNYRPDFTREECEKFVETAISLAVHRDGSSGGICRLVTVNAEGASRRFVKGNHLQKW
eukprot:TRINITY_DN3156_c0_g1_i1.p1 TRINITY_DN3156_c0_g1~~TRINITY_DN3156_c0_g1_i1.p1  ORF type:complete len:236 (+),score=56.19 TRINITY_DN3156_c0_g1_i1:67-774(+)